MSTILIKNAKMRDYQELTDLYIKDGIFAEIGPGLSYPADEVIDVAGKLVSAPFCDAHLHLDAVLSVGKPRYNMSGTLIEGINIWGERMQGLTKETIKKNARDVIKWEVANGSMFLRTHADATEPTGTVVEALLEVREEMKDLVDLQIVAFPQECIFTEKGHTDLMENAMKLGCDAVGGLPYMEYSPEDGLRDVKFVFDLAEKYGALIDIHCDETDDDQSRFIEVLAAEALRSGIAEKATASHTCAMHSYNNAYTYKLFKLLGLSKVNFISCPTENIHLQGRFDNSPNRRGLTRVKELNEAGINVCFAQDSMSDPWYPVGNGNLMNILDAGIHIAQMMSIEEISNALDLITVNGARTLNILDQYGIEAGKPANFINAKGEFEAVCNRVSVACSVRDGEFLFERAPEVITTTNGLLK